MIVAALLCCSASTAAIITVNRADDLITGGDGGCDLREAVNSANLNLGLEDCVAGEDGTLDIILIDVDSPIQLQSEIDVIGSVLIGRLGIGPNIEILAAPGSRHFHVTLSDPDDGQFALVSTHLKNGQVAGDGGSIWIEDAERVEIADNVFKNNQADDGGAIYANSSVVSDFKIMRNQFISNHATEAGGLGYGGAVYGYQHHCRRSDH